MAEAISLSKPKSRLLIVTISLLAAILVASYLLLSQPVSAQLPMNAVGTAPQQAAHNAANPLLTPTPGCGLVWREVYSPNVGTSSDGLAAVAVVSSNDVWAVGNSLSGGIYQTLIEHWNGAQWSVVPSPNVGSSNNYLNSVAAVSANDVWAVGSYFNISGVQQTLILRWNGTQWSVVSNPNVGPSNNALFGVAVVSANNVWAVGLYLYGATAQTLVENWNGSSWSVVSSPNVGTSPNILFSVAVVSANDIWAVGCVSCTLNGAIDQTLIEHWNGTQWSVVSSSNVGSSDNVLNSVAAVSANDVWAVGSYNNGTADQTLIQHWNGSNWSVVSSPNVGFSTNILQRVAVVSANNVWAVGYYRNGSTGQTLIEHWNGIQWSVVSSPNVGSSDNVLNSVAVVSARDLWAVGSYNNGGVSQTLVERYSDPCGTPSAIPTFTSLPTNTPSSLPSSTPIAPSSTPLPTNTSTPPTNTPLPIQTPGGPTSTPMPTHTNTRLPSNTSNPTNTSTHTNTPLPTQTPGGSTATPMPTNTNTPIPSPTLTLCILKFADVPASNTFYSNVACLACRGIDRGFACGGPNELCDPNNSPYFRPNALITRDDLAHMVAASAGFSEPAGEQRFQDVPVTHPYYSWIQRMANRNLIGGYPCSGAGEPCVAPNNLAYYRPAANATRGQIAKIVSNGAGFEDPPTGQTFEDVPPTQAFYIWVQRLTTPSRAVMGGYPCGRVGEPCGEDNKPYFRWGNNATRGQVAKIVANTFFPGCQPQVVTPTPAPSFTPGPVATNTRIPPPPPSSTPTPTPCAINTNYTIRSTSGAALVPGATNIGNNCDDCNTTIALPFPFKLYGRQFTSVRASDNGNLQFVSNEINTAINGCLPGRFLDYAILPYWDDLRTDAAGMGVFTSVSGSAPNRVFNIEWRAIYRDAPLKRANFEVRLYETSRTGQFDIIYGRIDQGGSSSTVGVQKDVGSRSTQRSCNAGTISQGLKLTFTQDACGTLSPGTSGNP